MMDAVQQQLRNEFADAWTTDYNGNPLTSAIVTAAPSSLPSGAYVLYIVDGPGDGYWGYHTWNSNGPYGYIFANDIVTYGQPVLYDPTMFETVASVLGHEIIEMLIDPWINSWAGTSSVTAFDGTVFSGIQDVLRDPCDPVEYDVYTGQTDGQSVTMSDFVFPSWFQADGETPYDQLQILPAPFNLDYGGDVLVSYPGYLEYVDGSGDKAPAGPKVTKAGLEAPGGPDGDTNQDAGHHHRHHRRHHHN